MSQQALSPKETAEYVVKAGEGKVNKKVSHLLLQGFLAGMFIAIGATGYFKVKAYTVDPGLGSFLGAAVFPTGIMAILLLGVELYTSDCMVVMGAYQRKYKYAQYFKMLGIVLLANFIGTLTISLLATGAGTFSEKMLHKVIESAEVKTTMPFSKMLISAIFCNIIVCSGVLMAYSAKDIISKLIAIWFPIMVFVLSGTEHIVANMFYLTMAYVNGAHITIVGILYNFAVVTVGNFIGGGIVIGGINYLLYTKNNA